MTALDWRFTHVHVYASDPDATVSWLTDGLGGEVVSRRRYAGRPAMTNIVIGGQLVQVRGAKDEERFVARGARSFGLDHIGLVVSDVPAALEELRARGVEPVTEFDNGFTVPNDQVAFLCGPDRLWVEIAAAEWYPVDPAQA